MRIFHFQRRAAPGQVSIERLFAELRAHLGMQCDSLLCPEPSRGFWPRLRNLSWARLNAGEVNHIVGDVHYLAFGLPAKRTVLTIHDCAALNRLTGWRRAILRYFWFTGPMKRAAVVTTISQTTKDELKHWVGELADDVVVVPNCVRSEFRPQPKAWPESGAVCLQVGTGWNKNVVRVAQALIATGCKLEIVGVLSDPQRAEIAKTGIAWQELGRVSDDELVLAYGRCDFLVFASLYEGFGLPILEAQAVGRPVITSHRSSMPEAAGEGALFVDPKSVEEIRAAVKRLLTEPDLRSELVAKGFENVAKYHPEAVAARYEEIYRRVIGERL